MNKITVFVSGRLDINKPENLKIYEVITRLCESLGFSVWLPHRDTRAYLRKRYFSPEERTKNLYEFDTKKVKSSKLVIAELTDPAFGVGGELTSCKEANVDVVAIAREHANVSATIIGNTAVKKFLRYKNVDELEIKLREVLEKYAKDKNYLRKSYDFHEIFEEWATPEQKSAYPWIFK